MVYALYTDLLIIINSLIFYLTVIPARFKTKGKQLRAIFTHYFDIAQILGNFNKLHIHMTES